MSDSINGDQLPPDVEALLELERAAPTPSDAVRNRLFARLEQSILSDDGGDGGGDGGGDSGGEDGGSGDGGLDLDAAGDAAASAGTSGAATAAATAAGAKTAVMATAAVVKLTVGVGVASFIAGGAVGAGIYEVVRPEPAAQELVRAAPEEVARVELPTAPVEKKAEPAQVHAPAVVPAPLPPPRPEPRARATETAVTDSLQAERSLIEQARSALARGDAKSTLTAVARHQREFPSGRMAEERDALEIQALVASGDSATASDRAAAFRAAYPLSLLRPAIDALAPEK